MSKDLSEIDFKALPLQALQGLQKLSRYRVLLFLLLLALVYGFIGFKIYTLSNPSTDTSSVSTEVSNLTPRINPAVAGQLETLQDNSVNVKALFVKARNNPFAE